MNGGSSRSSAGLLLALSVLAGGAILGALGFGVWWASQHALGSRADVPPDRLFRTAFGSVPPPGGGPSCPSSVIPNTLV